MPQPERPREPSTDGLGGGLPLRHGDKGPAVAQVRGHLARLGLIDDEAGPEAVGAVHPMDALYDDGVERGVLAFQQQRGLACDGIVGIQTWRRLDDARWQLGDRVLRFAPTHMLSGDDVSALQGRLLELGFDPGRIDGLFGIDTETALRDFQRNVGIPVDGLCGPVTFKALNRLARTVVGGAAQHLRETQRWAGSGPGLAGKIVVIDPGHGGSDPGAVGHGLAEADIVADLAARIEGRLVAVGVSAYLTRGRLAPDTAPPDESTRAALANRLDADLVLSLHVDAHPSTAASGVATFFYGSGHSGASSEVGRRVADLVQAEVVSRTDLLDGHTDGKTWDLLRRTKMPTIRVEIGYLTNPGDAARLSDPTFRDTVAEAVLVALQRLYLPVEPPTSVVLPSPAPAGLPG
ncbi:MAG: N-acetylmuramoyl-L-alanine amidase [Actinomycetes bacterium]